MRHSPRANRGCSDVTSGNIVSLHSTLRRYVVLGNLGGQRCSSHCLSAARIIIIQLWSLARLSVTRHGQDLLKLFCIGSSPIVHHRRKSDHTQSPSRSLARLPVRCPLLSVSSASWPMPRRFREKTIKFQVGNN